MYDWPWLMHHEVAIYSVVLVRNFIQLSVVDHRSDDHEIVLLS